MEKLKIGAVGAGNIFNSAHGPAYAECPNAVVTAIADTNLERAKATAEKFGIPAYYGSVEELLAKADVDAIDVCTWNNGHAPVVIAAANAGKAVMCEKPLTVSDELADAIAAAVAKNNTKFMLAVPGRFSNVNHYLREQVDAGKFGEIYFAKTAYVRRRGTPTGWFTDKKTAGGGPVIDIGIHAIDAAWYIMGCPKPVRVSSMVSEYVRDWTTKGISRWQGTPCPDGKNDTEDLGAGVIHFENGAMLMFEASWAVNEAPYSSTKVCGSLAGADVQEKTIYGERDGYLSDDKIGLDGNNAFLTEITHFADCVLNDKPVRYPIEQAVQMQKMLDAIYASAALKREVVIG